MAGFFPLVPLRDHSPGTVFPAATAGVEALRRRPALVAAWRAGCDRRLAGHWHRDTPRRFADGHAAARSAGPVRFRLK